MENQYGEIRLGETQRALRLIVFDLLPLFVVSCMRVLRSSYLSLVVAAVGHVTLCKESLCNKNGLKWNGIRGPYPRPLLLLLALPANMLVRERKMYKKSIDGLSVRIVRS